MGKGNENGKGDVTNWEIHQMYGSGTAARLIGVCVGGGGGLGVAASEEKVH
jgi:hypothetical protein